MNRSSAESVVHQDLAPELGVFAIVEVDLVVIEQGFETRGQITHRIDLVGDIEDKGITARARSE